MITATEARQMAIAAKFVSDVQEGFGEFIEDAISHAALKGHFATTFNMSDLFEQMFRFNSDEQIYRYNPYFVNERARIPETLRNVHKSSMMYTVENEIIPLSQLASHLEDVIDNINLRDSMEAKFSYSYVHTGTDIAITISW